jgi:glycosyltransferase involved in cell wall biosynthesis
VGTDLRLDLTVVVATFGDGWWRELATARAVPSADALDVPVVQVHGDTLHGARNTGLDMVDTEWVVFLDADDELEPGYLAAMGRGSADVRAPAVRYVTGGRPAPPRMPKVAGHTHQCVAACLAWGNWLVVGSAVRAGLVRRVGGWRDFCWSEDWDLWVRCWQVGATIEPVPAAVYRAHVRPGSRNRAPGRVTKLEAHRAIAAANRLPAP